ncbi:DUF421 domain-containing protein [Mesobacillus zeae]|uniref:DUF421 domain-containing protein n=1 Tax=Mesobacillus zeae TaxID=1917180 RepID=A0A398AY37_9BACI|nr:DUF421 domain-containing protein [Mesobacillus zeae]
MLIKDGKVSIKALERANLELEQLRGMLRQKGIFALREVKYVIQETSGEISVMKYNRFNPVTYEGLNREAQNEHVSVLLIDEGKIHEESLKELGNDENWLYSILRKEGVDDIKEVYYAERTEPHGLFIKKYKQCIC